MNNLEELRYVMTIGRADALVLLGVMNINMVHFGYSTADRTFARAGLKLNCHSQLYE